MPINIKGKQYITVAERVEAMHNEIKDKQIAIETEFLPIPGAVVCRATVKIGNNVFQGTSAANLTKNIEKQSPYEVAETSAIGRALGFAGFGVVEGIASADEVIKATYQPQSSTLPKAYDSNEQDILDSLEDTVLEGYCTIHKTPMAQKSKDGQTWWSHVTADGKYYCNGKTQRDRK